MSEWVKLKTADKVEIEAYVARPKGEPIAGLVVVQEIFGVNAHIQSVADGYAKEGYLAVAPAMFDRFEKGVELGYDEAGWTAARAFIPKLNPVVSLNDVAAAVDYARAETGKKVGVVGYCFGGTMAWLAATRLDVAAAVGYYGGYIANFAAEEPKAPVMLHFGSKDDHIPASVGEKVKELHPEVEVFNYDAGHAFNRDADPKAFVPEAAKLALERTLEFFKKYLS
jgi:carboxymethylenebutenolidase